MTFPMQPYMNSFTKGLSGDDQDKLRLFIHDSGDDQDKLRLFIHDSDTNTLLSITPEQLSFPDNSSDDLKKAIIRYHEFLQSEYQDIDEYSDESVHDFGIEIEPFSFDTDAD